MTEGVRFAVAGDPIDHSLSPLLHALVEHHLESERGMASGSPTLLLAMNRIEDVLAWGYSNAMPDAGPDWTLSRAPMQRFRTKALLDRAVRGIAPIESSPDDALAPFTPPGPPPHAAALVRISCTAPLKHQLSGAAMHLLGSSRTLGIVNTLGLVGDTWWGADTDGPGVVWVARHHGIDPSKGATLAVTGGGSTARSAAFAWIEAGGSVIPRLGRRELDLPLDVLKGVLEGGSPDVMLITEGDAMHPPGEDGPLVLDARYGRKEVPPHTLDGRWLLVAQHLLAWAWIWAPMRAAELPSLSGLHESLLAAEAMFLRA